MNRNQSIAGIVLTLNEEKDISRALRSLAWCDELLVVDSGSVDRTQEIVEHLGVRFVQHIQTPPFLITEQRNWALNNSHLKSEWVLFLDADEEVGDNLALEIRACINSPDGFDAYELTPRYWFFGQWLKRTQGFPNWHPRLLRRSVVNFQGGVWESFTDNATIQRIYTPYEHYAFSKGINEWINNHLRYADQEAADVIQYYATHKSSAFSTTRSLKLRILASYAWPLRPLARFIQKYILQFGFTESWQGLLFSLLMSFYELIVVIKILEMRVRLQERSV